MAISESRKKANKKWSDNNLEKVQFYAPKGFNDIIQKRALELGLSKASYLKKLIIEDMSRSAGETPDDNL